MMTAIEKIKKLSAMSYGDWPEDVRKKLDSAAAEARDIIYRCLESYVGDPVPESEEWLDAIDDAARVMMRQVF